MSEKSDNVNEKAAAQSDDFDGEGASDEQTPFDEASSSEETEASDDNLDELFLSPDEDSEGIIEMSEGADTAGDDSSEAQNNDAQNLEAGEFQALQERIDKAEKERGEAKERWMRATADLENLRKRSKRDKDEFRKYGHDKFALELIPVVDNLERALAHADKSADSGGIVDGVQMVYRQILGALEKHGIVGIEAHGCKFDPEHHEAIQQVETSEQDAGTVVEQFQKGYFIHDRLLRPAMVSVAKQPAGGNNKTNTETNSNAATDDSDADSGAGE